MGDDGFLTLGQDDGDAIAFADAEAAKGIGEAVGTGFQLAEADAVTTPVGVFQQQRGLGGSRRVLVAHVDADVVVLRNTPVKILAQLLEALIAVIEKAHGRRTESGLAHGPQ